MKPKTQGPVLNLDRETQLMARSAYDALEARGLVPHGCTFERWINDAVWERASQVQMGLVGVMGGTCFGSLQTVACANAPDGRRFRHLD